MRPFASLCSLMVVTLCFLGCDSKTASDTPASNTSEKSANISEKPVAAKQDIRGEEVLYEVDGVQLTGYIAYDANQTEQRPGVLVVHEWWGHNEYVRTRAHMLAKMGYTAFALDMYGDGKQAGHPDDAQKFMMEVMSNMSVGEQRFSAAKKILNDHETTFPNKTAAIGYCFGGAVVLHMARQGENLQGVASFHGNLSTQTPAKPHAIKSKILVMHGADDPFVPAEQVDTFKTEMAAAVADMKFIAYPNTVHAFTNPGATALGEKFDLPLAYNLEADEKSWSELDAFLKTIF
ncbi:MAG: dienelactone hydrolase family protein [Cellvibrionaceae bacterium]